MWLLYELAFGNTNIAHLSLFTEDEMEAPRSRAFSRSLSYFVKERANLVGTKRTTSQFYTLARKPTSLENKVQKES